MPREAGARPRRGSFVEDDAAAAGLPATARIGVAGREGRGLRLGVAVVAIALGLALVKPWDWIAPAPEPPPADALGEDAGRPPGRDATADGAVAADARPGLEDVACLSERSWMAVVDEVEGASARRSWTRLLLVPATGPTDPAMVATRAWAAVVPRIGFCVPRRDGGRDRLDVAAWRVEPAADETAAAAVPIAPLVVAGGTIADRGALYAPPADAGVAGGPGTVVDPEAAWAADGGEPRPAGWRAGPSSSDGTWPPGRYAFRVRLPGAGPGGADEAWFAIDLLGAWPSPVATPPTRP